MVLFGLVGTLFGSLVLKMETREWVDALPTPRTLAYHQRKSMPLLAPQTVGARRTTTHGVGTVSARVRRRGCAHTSWV